MTIIKKVLKNIMAGLVVLGLSVPPQTAVAVPHRKMTYEQPVNIGYELGELLKGKEYNSPEDYNAMYATQHDLDQFGGVDTFAGKKLTGMTLREVVDAQDRLNAPSVRWARSKGYDYVPYSSAVGKYQVVKGTLLHAVHKLALPLDTVFSVEVQDQIGEYLLLNKRSELKEYLDGDSDNIQAAMIALGLEWEAFNQDRYPNRKREQEAEKFLRRIRQVRVRSRKGGRRYTEVA
jgi:hypothetical protein